MDLSARDIANLLEMIDANHFGWAGMMAPVIMGNADRPELATELSTNFCRMDRDVARHFAAVTFLSDHCHDFVGLTTPALLLHSTDDALVPPQVQDYLKAALPQASHWTIQATGHCPHMSAPEETVALIGKWMRGRPDVEDGCRSAQCAADA